MIASLLCGERLLKCIDRLIVKKKGRALSDDEVMRIVSKHRRLERQMRDEHIRNGGRNIERTPIEAINAVDVRTTERLYHYRVAAERYKQRRAR